MLQMTQYEKDHSALYDAYQKSGSDTDLKALEYFLANYPTQTAADGSTVYKT